VSSFSFPRWKLVVHVTICKSFPYEKNFLEICTKKPRFAKSYCQIFHVFCVTRKLNWKNSHATSWKYIEAWKQIELGRIVQSDCINIYTQKVLESFKFWLPTNIIFSFPGFADQIWSACARFPKYSHIYILLGKTLKDWKRAFLNIKHTGLSKRPLSLCSCCKKLLTYHWYRCYL